MPDSAEQLARKRDRLRDGQVRDRAKVHDLQSALKALQQGIAKRGRQIKNLSRRIKKKRKEGSASVSGAGRDFITVQEGLVLHTYNDSQGHCTACVGHLISMAGCPGQVNYSREECDKLLAADLKACEDAINDTIHRTLKANEFDALACIAFNIGTNGFRTSTLAARVNAGASDRAIREAFLMWDNPPELRSRREREADLYLHGKYH